MNFIAEEHNNPTDSQVLIALTGNPKMIRAELECIIRNIDVYNKPLQGIISSSGCVREVITPVWEGKTY